MLCLLKYYLHQDPQLIYTLSWFLYDNLNENIYKTVPQHNGRMIYFRQMEFTI